MGIGRFCVQEMAFAKDEKAFQSYYYVYGLQKQGRARIRGVNIESCLYKGANQPYIYIYIYIWTVIGMETWHLKFVFHVTIIIFVLALFTDNPL